MGKSKRIKAVALRKNVPLERQIVADDFASSSGRVKSRDRMDEDESFVDERSSKKILIEARKQQEEFEENLPKHTKSVTHKLGPDNQDSDSEDGDLSDVEDICYEDIKIDEEDEKALEQFMSRENPIRRTLADIIMEKITEKKTEMESQFTDVASVKMAELDDRVVEMYKGVRQILSKYRSGKLPKAFKIIPSLANWEQILYLTEPESWSAATVYQAVRIFSSNLKDKMAQRFYNLVLLPRVRDDITEYKKLNFHLYQALRKALFKPAAFFKGVILPLCESGNCTLREAIIIGSVISKNSIPVLHSSAAILKIAEMEYSGTNSIFLKLLFDKKYALPYRVIDATVYHYLRFRNDQRELPVLWHQSLLTFVQRYKEDLSREQKDELMDILRHHAHPKITGEIRRELINSKCRGEEKSEPMID